MARTLLCLVGAVLSGACTACGGGITGYRGAPIDGRVVDTVSKAPLVGVIVVVKWNIEYWIHDVSAGNMLIGETLTDADGAYAFPAWGPRWPPPGTSLDRGAPDLVFFKPGYTLLRRGNEYRGQSLPSLRSSQWSGRVVELAPPTDAKLAAWRDAGAFNSILGAADPCAWQQVPRFTAAALRHAQTHAETRIPSLAALWLGQPSFETLESLDRKPNLPKRCADPRVALKEYL